MRGGREKSSSRFWLWGFHSVLAALQNPERVCHQLLCVREGALKVEPLLVKLAGVTLKMAVHQGIALCGNEFLAEKPAVKRLVVLDQITDPQNFGAILRSACTFGMDGVLLTERHSPTLEGVVGKSASGALEKIPLILPLTCGF